MSGGEGTTPRDEGNVLSEPLLESLKIIDDYGQAELTGLAVRTVDAYIRVLRQVALWLAARSGTEERFRPEDLTEAAIADYIELLTQRGFSWSHRKRALAVLNQFCNWLIARGDLSLNPTRGVALEEQPPHGAEGLSEVQRAIVRRLMEPSPASVPGATPGRGIGLRGVAIFALGYWAGCSASEISNLLVTDAHLESDAGWLRIRGSRGVERDIRLHSQARAPLAAYLASGTRFQTSIYLFTSQRERPAPTGSLDGWQLGEAAIHEWWKSVKAGVSETEWTSIRDVTFLDLRHDFAQRAREAGWSREELAAYLGQTLRRDHSVGQHTAASPLLGDLKQMQLIKG